MKTVVLGVVTATFFLLAVLPPFQPFSAPLWLAGLVCLVILTTIRVRRPRGRGGYD